MGLLVFATLYMHQDLNFRNNPNVLSIIYTKSPKPARKLPKARPSPPEYRTLKPEPARIPNLKARARPISEICGPTHHYFFMLHTVLDDYT